MNYFDREETKFDEQFMNLPPEETQADPTNRAKPLPKMPFCKHWLVPTYCAKCKFGETVAEVISKD